MFDRSLILGTYTKSFCMTVELGSNLLKENDGLFSQRIEEKERIAFVFILRFYHLKDPAPILRLYNSISHDI